MKLILTILLFVPCAAFAQPDELTEAESLAKVAARHFRAGNFEVAATVFLDAYAASQKPAVLFNAARAYEESGQTENALRLFRLYLTVERDEQGLADARARIERLATSDLPQGATPTFALPDPPRKIQTKTWLLGSTGLASVLAGAVLAGLAAQASHELNANPGAVDYAARYDHAERQWFVGAGMIGLGTGLTGLATWFAYKDKK